MGTIERLDIAIGGFHDRLASSSEDALERPSPCEGWSGRDVVEHTIGAVVAVASFVEPPVHDDASAALLERFDAAASQLRERTADPERAARVIESPFGTLAFKQIVSSIAVHDLLVHTWDLARAVGGDERLDPQLCAETLASMLPMDAALRGHGFADRIEPPQDADAQTQLLCFLGREP